MSSGSIVVLDVGGTIFKTSKSTLTKFDGFFKTMLETGVPSTTNESGAFVIDRSPKHFDRILNFMRDGNIKLPNTSEDVGEIQKEAQFYGLEVLVQMCSMEIENRKVEATSGNFDPQSDSTGTFVKLNIRGTIFETSKSTLTKFDGFFKTMLETGSPIGKDASGALLIDRDPVHFRLILNYMRDGHLNLPESSEDVKEIQNEATYYLLDGLVELCQVELQKRAEIIVNFESEIEVLENEREYVQVISEPEKPVLIIYCSIGKTNRAMKPDGFHFKPFVSKNNDKLDTYFRPFKRDDDEVVASSTDWSWSLHWRKAHQYKETEERVVSSRQRVEEERKKRSEFPFETELATAIELFFRNNNIPQDFSL